MRSDVLSKGSFVAALVLGSQAFLVPGSAEATQVDRETVTLGRLADGVDDVLLARVEQVEPAEVRLTVEERIKGRAGRSCSVPRGRLAWIEGERVLLFLSRDAEGTLAAPRSSWERVRVADEAEANALVAAVRGRLPRVGGDPKVARRALFAQLEAKLLRLREDAALDLVAYRDLTATSAELDHLARAITAGATPALLLLAERLGARRLLEPVLAAAREAKSDAVRAAAGRALASLDPRAGLEALRETLTGEGSACASALAALAYLPGPEAEALLAQSLAAPRASIRLAALRSVAARGRAREATREALEARAWQTEGAERRVVLAALARVRAGRALARIQAEHPDAAVRRLAFELRRDPVTASRHVLRAAKAAPADASQADDPSGG